MLRLRALLALATALWVALAASAEDLYLVGGELHVGDGRVIEDAVIHVRGETIRDVAGPAARARIPADARVADVSGHWVTPGLIAAHTQLGLVEIDLERSTRDTERKDDEPVSAGYDPAPAINADSTLIPVQAIEGVTAAAVAPTGGLLAGQVAWIDLLPGEPARIVDTARIAVAGSLGPRVASSRAAALNRLRRVLHDARFYARNRSAYDRRALRDLTAHPLDLEALLPVLERRVPLTMVADRVSDILALVDIARDFEIRGVVLGGAEAWRVRDVLAAAGIPVILRPTSNIPWGYDHLGARLESAALLHEAGVEIGIAVLGDPHNVRNVTQEAGVAVAHGLDRESALSSVTRNIARIYGMQDRYGTVEPDKVASLAVWEGDPFELSNWPVAVYVRGRQLPLVSRQTLLRDRYLDLPP